MKNLIYKEYYDKGNLVKIRDINARAIEDSPGYPLTTHLSLSYPLLTLLNLWVHIM